MEPELLLPAFRIGTERSPIFVSVASGMASREKKIQVFDATFVWPVPWFFVVSVTVMLAPAAALEGAEIADTMRSEEVGM